MNGGGQQVRFTKGSQQRPHPCETLFGSYGIAERIADEAALVARAPPEFRDRSLVVPAVAHVRCHTLGERRPGARNRADLPRGSQSGILRLISPRP